MSQDQQLISRYTNDLSLPSSTFYYLHFLKITKDEPAINMLKSSLKRIQAITRCEQLQKILDKGKFDSSVIRSFGRHNSNFDSDMEFKQTRGRDYDFTAKRLLEKLDLEDALRMFKKSSQIDPTKGKFYKERAELCLLLNNFRKALSMAIKGHHDDIILAAALADGNFSVIQNRFESYIRIITKNLLKFKGSVITRYEFEILLIILSFARLSSSDVKSKTNIIFENSNFHHDNLKEMANLFSNRDFPQFLQKIPEIEVILNYSIHTSVSCSKFIEAIKENIIINEISPFSIVSLDNLKQKFDIPVPQIKKAIIKAIHEKKLNGKLDMVNNTYIGGIANLESYEIDKLYIRSMNSLQTLQLAMWMKRYNKENTPKKAELIQKDKNIQKSTKVTPATSTTEASKTEVSTTEASQKVTSATEISKKVEPAVETLQIATPTVEASQIPETTLEQSQTENSRSETDIRNEYEEEEEIFFDFEGNEEED